MGDQRSGIATNRAVIGLAIVCGILCLALMGARLHNSISFSEPLQLVTSGWEQESLVAIWAALNDQPVYVSRHDMPFRWSIYNWLYYQSYVGFTGGVLALFGLSEHWLPTVSRFLTILGVVATAIAAYWSFHTVWRHDPKRPHLFFATFAILVAAGPLVGYWGMTTRPDVWSLALEIMAIAAYWSISNRRPLTAVIVFCALAYAAWAFKQSAVISVGALGLLLLVRWRWRELLLLSVTMIGCWGVTLLIGTDAYRESILLRDLRLEYSSANAVRIAIANAPKLLPGLVGILCIVIAAAQFERFRSRLWRDDISVYAISGILIGSGLASLATRQSGAAENYYFIPYFFCLLLIVSAVRLIEEDERWPRQLISGGLSLGWGLQAAAIATVLVGLNGTLTVRHLHDLTLDRKSCIDQLPRPLFVDDLTLSLPWLTPDNPSFVLGFGYRIDRRRGAAFEHDGIGGLIAKGYFSALVFGGGRVDEFDGAKLSAYRPVNRPCADLKVYLRYETGEK